jgi:tRNA (guanine-N7-)-methyltransferase
MGRRIRKHANPFQVRTTLGLVDRRVIFGREAPLEVELGPGNASFLFDRARAHPERDFVGLEVRRPLVETANQRRDTEGPKNLHVFYANASENLRLAAAGVILGFHIHFPDPCFKKRHWKRRVVQPNTVRIMSELLPIGGFIYAQSDVKALAEEMFDFMIADGALLPRDRTLLVERPFPESTAWEKQHEAEGEPIYRMLFEKIREPAGPIPELEMRHTDPKRIASLDPSARLDDNNEE